MHTLGYDFKPWTDAKAIADGPAILDYVRETARENGLMDRIRFGHRVRSARWDSGEARWTVAVDRAGDGPTEISGNLLFMCSGYYEYEGGHTPHFEGRETFGGRILHPQFWPETLDYTGKRVVIIGSGATAMTLAPAMANSGAWVTMVQRSPTYVISRPDVDALANTLRRWLPAKLAYAITRWKNIAMQGMFYRQTRVRPEKVKTPASRPGAAPPRPGLRCEDPLHAALQPLGPAALPDSQRRPVPRHQVGRAGNRDRPDRALHRERPRTRLRPGSCRPISSSLPRGSSSPSWAE